MITDPTGEGVRMPSARFGDGTGSLPPALLVASSTSNLETSPAKLEVFDGARGRGTGFLGESSPSTWFSRRVETGPSMPSITSLGLLGHVFGGIRNGAGLSGEL